MNDCIKYPGESSTRDILDVYSIHRICVVSTYRNKDMIGRIYHLLVHFCVNRNWIFRALFVCPDLCASFRIAIMFRTSQASSCRDVTSCGRDPLKESTLAKEKAFGAVYHGLMNTTPIVLIRRPTYSHEM